jgi:stress response protein YsnF
VTVSNFDNSLHDTIVDILDDEGSVDLDARESEWRSSGSYTDYRSSQYYNEEEYNRTHRSGQGLGTIAAGTAASDVVGRAVGTVGAAVDTNMGGAGSRGTIHDDGLSDRGAGSQMAADASAGGLTGTRVGTDFGSDLGAGQVSEDGTVKVVEERLAVGKREAEAGRVRVRSYVREVPVEAEVDLRATRVFVERHPVDRPVSGADAFQDRVIEARETAEEAVVAKDARVVEEIGLREQTEVQHQTVRDTVRKTEVEIEDERTGATQSLTGGTSGIGGTGGTGGTGGMGGSGL